ncbi:MAG: hypothetical protein SCH71_05340 [Desulfobulbaceae bacterium]|nr:hypothetical protein [Desulfobulbaceae bacterium]
MRKFFLACLLLVPLSLLNMRNASGLTMQSQTLTVNNSTVELKVPAGMQVEFLTSMDAPRLPALGPDNEMLVGSRGSAVYRLE